MNHIKYLLLFSLTFFLFQKSQAQYFGQNKVKYKKFDFKVVESETFDTYHYLEKDSLIIGLVKDAEKWRVRHEQVFKDSFDYKVPIILYSNHGDFQQTATISGLIGTATGGVTEGLKNRVIFPVTPSYAQTDHVMGHELVHAHQYNMIKSADSLSFNHMSNIPLWMTEGMAEYLSIGTHDAHTAMWMRDAVANDFFPRIKDLHKSRYFPYRFGHAFWAFIGETFGDDMLLPLYKETAKLGVKEAFKRQLSMPVDSFSVRWKTATEDFYKKQIKNRSLEPVGSKLINEKNGGRLNISPSVSPDGKYFIFLSERNIFSLDLFLANAKTGEIIKKLSTRTHKSHLDALDAFESAGTWSPEGNSYAFVIYSEGKNKIAISSMHKGSVIAEFFIPGISSFSNLDWSPDGKKILFSGLKNGQSDLFTVDVITQEVRQLTNDYFANMQPKWSPNGKSIVYVTDKQYGSNRPNRKLSFEIVSLSEPKISVPKIFPNSNNLNPTYSPDGKYIYFLSDREGFRDIYQYEIATEKISQLTNFVTGVSGITKYSQAITVSSEKNELLYSHYNDSKYNIYKVKIDELTANEVSWDNVKLEGAKLPSLNLKKSFVEVNLQNENILTKTDRLKEREYKPKFKLDYISNGGVGISTGRYGTGMVGGVNMLFGDMLNDNQMYIGAMLNGDLQDFGGQVAYLNRKKRYAWGGGLSHIPYRYGYRYIQQKDTVVTVNNNQYTSDFQYVSHIYRIFRENASTFAYYPFSKATRVEVGATVSYYSFSFTQETEFYNSSYGSIDFVRERESYADPFLISDFSLAFVGDNSSFGLTAPMKGYRYRFEVASAIGEYRTTSFTADARKYLYVKPISVAFRGLVFSQIGNVLDNPLNYPIYLGYGNMVRGYTYNSIESGQGDLTSQDLFGSKVVLSNFEIRFPFTGPERLAAIKSGFLFTDLNLFFDAGITWGEYSLYNYNTGAYDDFERSLDTSSIISSVGISTRINLFGQLILEPYYAFPLQIEGLQGGVFGLNFTPGW